MFFLIIAFSNLLVFHSNRFGRGRLRLMLKIEAIRIPNILIPDNFDLRLPAETSTSNLVDSEETRETSKDTEMKKDQSKEDKSQAQNKTMKTFRSIKKSMSIKRKEYESAPSTPSKYSTQKVATPVKAVHADDMMPSTSKQMMQNRSQSVYHASTPTVQHSSPTQSFFKSNINAASQITGQINRFTKHARNSLKKLNRFGGTKKGDKESSRDENTDSTGRSSAYERQEY